MGLICLPQEELIRWTRMENENNQIWFDAFGIFIFSVITTFVIIQDLRLQILSCSTGFLIAKNLMAFVRVEE